LVEGKEEFVELGGGDGAAGGLDGNFRFFFDEGKCRFVRKRVKWLKQTVGDFMRVFVFQFFVFEFSSHYVWGHRSCYSGHTAKKRASRAAAPRG
jgi:hypothetical protein